VLRFGYKASAEQFAPAELLSFAVHAEHVGFDSVFISDHFQPFRHNGGHAPFAMSWLGALGAKTSRILMGTSVLTPGFRYHPSIVAQAFGTLGSLYPGRVILGMGTGESLNEVPVTGMVWPEQKERTARFKESLGLIRKLWTEDRVSFEGQYYRTQSATIYDRPPTPLPIYVAAAGPVLAAYAGETAEGFVCTSGKGWDLYNETLLPNVHKGLGKAARVPADFDMMIEMKVSFDTDHARAMNDTRYWAPLSLSAEQKMSVEDPLEMEQLADSLTPEAAARRWIVSTDPDEHVERIRPYFDMGFNHLVFHAPGPDQRGFLDRYAEHILPRLRQAYARRTPR
jgi:coenzyme F420-dependent glucose-6-phosphate dehydrogenase